MRVTHATLKIGIDNIQATLKEIKPEIKKNTAFRNKMWGIGIGITSVSTILSACIVLLIKIAFGV